MKTTTTTQAETVTPKDFTRVNNDVNGNPRYVCHYLKLITSDEEQEIRESGNREQFGWIQQEYNVALNRAKKIGGRKFHNKQYGGGIVFQSYNIQATADRINELLTTGK